MKKKLKKYWIIVVILIIIAGMVYLLKKYNPENTSLFPPCIIYKYTGLKCAGCGMTRAVHYLLNFNFKKALLFNPLIFVFIVYFIYILMKCTILKLNKKNITKDCFNISLYIVLFITVMYMVIRNFVDI